jgi:uncharacterized membrane protein
MSTETDTRDRVIRLETKLEAIAEKQEVTDKKVTEMHTILVEAQGGKKTLKLGISVFSAIAAIVAYMKDWLPFLPFPKA